MRFAICNELFEGWEWAKICRFVASMGYDEIEIAPFTLAADVRSLGHPQRTQIRDTARENGLAIAGLHWLLVSPPGLQLLSPDRAARLAAQDYLVALVDFCADLDGKVMVLGSPKQRNRPEGMEMGEAIGCLLETLAPVAERANGAGITLCLEPLPAEDTNFLNTLQEVARVLDRLDSTAAKLILDVKSMGAEQFPVPELVRQFGPRAGHFHANDTNRRGPGDGETDYAPIVHALRDVGYDACVSVEVFDYTPNPETIARGSLEYLKRVFT